MAKECTYRGHDLTDVSVAAEYLLTKLKENPLLREASRYYENPHLRLTITPTRIVAEVFYSIPEEFSNDGMLVKPVPEWVNDNIAWFKLDHDRQWYMLVFNHEREEFSVSNFPVLTLRM